MVGSQDMPQVVVVGKMPAQELHNNQLEVGIHCCTCSHFHSSVQAAQVLLVVVAESQACGLEKATVH